MFSSLLPGEFTHHLGLSYKPISWGCKIYSDGMNMTQIRFTAFDLYYETVTEGEDARLAMFNNWGAFDLGNVKFPLLFRAYHSSCLPSTISFREIGGEVMDGIRYPLVMRDDLFLEPGFVSVLAPSPIRRLGFGVGM